MSTVVSLHKAHWKPLQDFVDSDITITAGLNSYTCRDDDLHQLQWLSLTATQRNGRVVDDTFKGRQWWKKVWPPCGPFFCNQNWPRHGTLKNVVNFLCATHRTTGIYMNGFTIAIVCILKFHMFFSVCAISIRSVSEHVRIFDVMRFSASAHF